MTKTVENAESLSVALAWLQRPDDQHGILAIGNTLHLIESIIRVDTHHLDSGSFYCFSRMAAA